jgi:hypothetical protein
MFKVTYRDELNGLQEANFKTQAEAIAMVGWLQTVEGLTASVRHIKD